MNYELDLINPLESPLMKKTFRLPKLKQREIIAKEIIDEVIFNSKTCSISFHPCLQRVTIHIPLIYYRYQCSEVKVTETLSKRNNAYY